MNYLITYPNNSLIVNAVVNELYDALQQGNGQQDIVLLATHNNFESDLQLVRDRLHDCEIIAFDPDLLTCAIFAENPGTKITIILSTNAIVHNKSLWQFFTPDRKSVV